MIDRVHVFLYGPRVVLAQRNHDTGQVQYYRSRFSATENVVCPLLEDSLRNAQWLPEDHLGHDVFGRVILIQHAHHVMIGEFQQPRHDSEIGGGSCATGLGTSSVERSRSFRPSSPDFSLNSPNFFWTGGTKRTFPTLDD